MIDAVPEKAIDVINNLIELYASSIVKEKTEASERSLKFIDERLAFITEELYQAERNVESYQRRIQAPLGIEQIATQYSNKISKADENLTELYIQRDFLKNLSSFLQADGNEFKMLTVPKEVGGDIVASLAGQYNELLLEREQLLLSADLNNPYVKMMENQIISIRSSLVQSLGRLNQDLDNRISSTRSQLDPAINNLNQIPRRQRELVNITRQKNIKEELFLYLLQSREKAGLSIASQTVNTKLINPPGRSGLVSPNRRLIYAAFIMFGFMLPFGFIVGTEVLDNTIRNEKDIKEHTDVPFLGNLGVSVSNDPLVVAKGSRSAIAEMFHLLKTNLQFFLPKSNQSKVILLTSNVSGEGKTFVTSNLGASISLSGQKVLCVGFDMRKPKLSKYLTGVKSDQGISNYLIGAEKDIDRLIRPIEDYPNLFFIGSGPVPPNPVDLIPSGRTHELFNYFRSNFDYILVDTSPVGLVTDALLLGKFVDASIFITRFKKTRIPQLPLIDDLWSTKKLPNCSVVLNGVRRGGKYGYGYGFGYGYGYGYGYYQKEPRGLKRLFRTWGKRSKVRKSTKKLKQTNTITQKKSLKIK